MHRIDHATRKADLFGAGKAGFTEGSPGAEAATVVTADIANAFQEEIARAIEARGIALSKPNNAQLTAALATPLTAAEADIDALQAQVRPDLATRRFFFAPGDGTVEWDTVNGRPTWYPASTVLGARDVLKSYYDVTFGKAHLTWQLRPGGNLPLKSTITRVVCWVKPGASYGPGDEMVLSVYRIDATSTPLLAGGGTSTTGSTTIHGISSGAINVPVEAADPFVDNTGLSIVLTGGPRNDDLVYFLELSVQRTEI